MKEIKRIVIVLFFCSSLLVGSEISLQDIPVISNSTLKYSQIIAKERLVAEYWVLLPDKTSFQEKLEKDLQTYLATIFGEGGVRVMASVKLDFDSEVTSSKLYSTPIEGEENGLVRSMTEIQESTVNAESGGVPGTDSNAEATNYNEMTGAGSEYQKASKTINYEMNETLTTVEKAQGQIEDITVSVIINETALVDQTLTEEQRTEITDLVSAAAGLDTRVVQVSAQTFTIPEDPFADQVEEGGIPWWIFAVVAVAVLGAAGGALFVLRRKNKTQEEERIMRELEEQREIEEIRLEEADHSSPKYQIERFIETNPEVVAQLLRAWLNED